MLSVALPGVLVKLSLAYPAASHRLGEPQRLLRLRQQLLAQQRVGGGNEIAEPQPVQRGDLRVGGRPAGSQDAGQRASSLS
jgi:hypothetical protein